MVRHGWLIGVVLVVAGCSEKPARDFFGDPRHLHPSNQPLAMAIPDLMPRLEMRVGEPFQLEFGRGTGKEGLDLVKLDENGVVTLYQTVREQKDGRVDVHFETATLHPSPESIAQLAKAVQDDGVLGLSRIFHGDPAGVIFGGTQWLMWVKQGKNDKALYCDNYFPDEIVRFAVDVDAFLKRAGLAEAQWSVPADPKSRKHEGRLWEIIHLGTANTLNMNIKNRRKMNAWEGTPNTF